jgi:ribose transport system substrate-binding protein
VSRVKRSSLVTALLAVLTLFAVSACTTGTDASTPTSNGGDGGYRGVPKQIQPADAEKFVNDAFKGKKVFYSAIANGYPFEDQYLNVFKASFEQLGIEYKSLTADVDPQKEAQNAQTLLNQDPDVLIVHAGDSSILNSLIKQAQSQGVYVVNLNLMTTYTPDVYVGGNFDIAETALAESMAASCKDAGKSQVAIIRGFSGDGLSQIAGDAWNKVFKAEGIEVVADQAQDYDATKAHDMAQVVIQQNPDMCGFIGTWDSMMIGASNAVDQAGKTGDIKVYTSDSSSVACDALRSGSMEMALDYGVGMMADQIVALVQNLLITDPGAGTAGSVVFPRYKLITKDDVSNDDPRAACYTGQPL